MIPKDNFIQVRYEDFVDLPLQVTQNIYDALWLAGSQDATPAFETYILTQLHIKKDQYSMSNELKRKIEEKWGFSIKEFGY